MSLCQHFHYIDYLYNDTFHKCHGLSNLFCMNRFTIGTYVRAVPVRGRIHLLTSIAVAAVLHLPGIEGQDLDRRVVDPVFLKQHLLNRADDRFMVG